MYDPVTRALAENCLHLARLSLQARTAVQQFLDRAEAGLSPLPPTTPLTKQAISSPYDSPWSSTASYPLEGRLYLAADGSLRLAVPTALGIGLFDAAAPSGLELPKDSSGRYRASVLVMTPEEVGKAGGPDALTERGHTARYAISAIGSERSKDGTLYYVALRSPSLSALRRSYGLPSFPPSGDFRLPFALRRPRVLYSDPAIKKAVSRAKNILGLPSLEFKDLETSLEKLDRELRKSLSPLDQALASFFPEPIASQRSASSPSAASTKTETKDRTATNAATTTTTNEDPVASWLDDTSADDRDSASPSPSPSVSPPSVSALSASRRTVLKRLLQAKAYSDRKQYPQKHEILRSLLSERPDEFVIDSVDPNGFVGLTHLPTRFKIHAPPWILPHDKKIRHISPKEQRRPAGSLAS